MKDLVSILIPCYNAERWLHETIESALAQTWPNKEIIIVDDGSTDNTLMIARRYESSIFKVVSQENSGACASRNKALEWSQGAYIQWLDADDLLAPDKIEKQMEIAYHVGNPKVLLSCSWGKFHYRYWKTKFEPNGLWHNLSPIEWLSVRFGTRCWMSNSAWLTSRTLTELAGPWDERLLRDQDMEYFCRVVAMSEGVIFVPEAKNYVRRINSKSVSSNRSTKALESHFLSKTLCINYLLSLEDSAEIRNVCIMLLQKSIKEYYPDHESIIQEANKLAKELGGMLLPPTPIWKVSIAKRILGLTLANFMRRLWNVAKNFFTMNWDRLLYNLSKKFVGDRIPS